MNDAKNTFLTSLHGRNQCELIHNARAYGLIVEIVGQKGGKSTKITLKNSHPPMDEWGGKYAYGKNVGIPLSIGAQMIAKRKCEKEGSASTRGKSISSRVFQ